jgi:3-oxoacyl-[acyl-carrier-protein] synthase-1
MTGHSLGATGVQEAIYSLMMIQDGFVAPSINIEELCEEADGLMINTETIEKNVQSVLSNSFGFGGTNASLVISKY